MALALPIALLGGVLEDADLLALAVLDHGGGHGSALYSGSAKGGLVPVQNRQHLVEGDGLPGLGLQLLDEEGVALRHLVLLAAGYDDCLHSIQLLYYGLALPGGVSPLAYLFNAALIVYQQNMPLSRFFCLIS